MNRLEHITALPLSSEAYAPYGDVIAARPDMDYSPANQGTARRYDDVAQLKNLRAHITQPGVKIFHCTPATSFPFEVKLLEKHPNSSQIFIPLKDVERYLVIVALGGDQPDLSTMRAFVVPQSTGISYRPGVWHHPMIALDKAGDFVSLVYNDGGPGDCEEFYLKSPYALTLNRR